MSRLTLTRREMLRLVGVGSAGALLSACVANATPQVVKETVEVEKVVQQTVEVEKVVQQTVQVEKLVTQAPAPEGPVTIEFWQPFGDLNARVIDGLVKQWNEANPNTQVKTTFTPNVTDAGTNPKFLAAALSGNPPDVFIHDGSSFSTAMNLNAFTALDDLIKASNVKADDFFPWSWEKGTWKAHQYGVPLDTDARALFVNKDLLSKAGIQEAPKTIEELEEAADKLTVEEGDRITRMGFIPWIGNSFLIFWGWDWGLKVWDAAANKIHLNADEMVQALTWEIGYAEKYGVSAIQSFQQGFGSGANDPFRSGQVAMEVNGNWELNGLKEYAPNLQYDVSPIPYPAGRSPMTFAGGFVMGVPRGSKHVQQAWDFVYWFTAGDAAGQYAIQTEHLPTNIAAAKQMGDTSPTQKIFLDLLPVAYIEPVIPEWTLAWDAHVAAEQEALFGQKSPKDALDAANEKVQAAIDTRLAAG